MLSTTLGNRDFVLRAIKGAQASSKKIKIDISDDIDPMDTESGYGWQLDESTMLANVPDPYDCCPFLGPDPEILPNCPNGEPEIYTNVTLGKPGKEIQLDIMNLSYDIVRPGYTVIFNGSRRTGKSKLIHGLCRHLRPLFKEVYVFTNTKASGEYFRKIPIARVYEGFKPDILLQIIQRQKSFRRAQTRGELEGESIEILVIIDDCISDKLQWQQRFNQIFWEGRHYGVSLWVTSQDIKAIAPGATINSDVSFIFPFGDARSTESVNEKYLYFLDKWQSADLLKHLELRKKHHVIAIDMAHKYNPIDRRIAIGCVNVDDEPSDFVMGTWALWEDSKDQLKGLGFEHLVQKPDQAWGILKPDQLEKWYSLGCPIIDQHQRLKK